jgi:hypothetical protein
MPQNYSKEEDAATCVIVLNDNLLVNTIAVWLKK